MKKLYSSHNRGNVYTLFDKKFHKFNIDIIYIINIFFLVLIIKTQKLSFNK